MPSRNGKRNRTGSAIAPSAAFCVMPCNLLPSGLYRRLRFFTESTFRDKTEGSRAQDPGSHTVGQELIRMAFCLPNLTVPRRSMVVYTSGQKVRLPGAAGGAQNGQIGVQNDDGTGQFPGGSRFADRSLKPAGFRIWSGSG